MAKEYSWVVTADGLEHRVTCSLAGNRYQIWVDDEDLTTVYLQTGKKARYGLEQKLQIGGKTCLFVVWDQRPDLVVDGKMVQSGKDYDAEKAKRKKGMLRVSWIMFAFGIAILCFVAVWAVLALYNGWQHNWRHYSLYLIAAVWIIVDATLERKYWLEH